MSSKLASNGIIQTDLNEENLLSFPARSISHHSSSFSSISSFSSCNESPAFSPKSPLESRRVPFSWEKVPGIPKKQRSMKINTSSSLLPLPPAGNQYPYINLNSQEVLIKKNDSQSFRKDPFFAAFVECSKDHDHNEKYDPIFSKISKIARSLSGISISCKSTCAVSDSMSFIRRFRGDTTIVLGHIDRSSKKTALCKTLLS